MLAGEGAVDHQLRTGMRLEQRRAGATAMSNQRAHNRAAAALASLDDCQYAAIGPSCRARRPAAYYTPDGR